MKKKLMTHTEDVLEDSPCLEGIWPVTSDKDGCWYWAYSPDDDIMYQVWIDYTDPVDIKDKVMEYL